MNKKKDRKINLIKALKHENKVLGRAIALSKYNAVNPLRIYETNLKHLRTSFRISNRDIYHYGERAALDIAKRQIVNQFENFLKEDNIKKVVDYETDTTIYTFDYWVE